jgi:soluble lytic murein transglycosylase-like protein
VRLPLRPQVQSAPQAAALPDIGWLAEFDAPRAAPPPVFRLSADEVVAMAFQQIAVFSPPETAPEEIAFDQHPADSDRPRDAAAPAFRLSADEIVAMSFQQTAIYSPPAAEPEKLGRRQRDKAKKAERQSVRQTRSAGTEVVTTKVKSPVLAYATAEPAGRRSLLAGMFRAESDSAPDFTPLASGGYSAVKYEARIQRVPEKLALSIARIESNGACGAQSSANAIGVMQIKHATARMIGYNGTAAGLRNCKTSAKWGVKYLAMCLDLADDDVKKAALCYNQGHGTLTNKRKYGNRVERREAKGYVAKMKALGWRL